MSRPITKKTLSESVLIVAHPDDEILWFSSIIEQVDKVVICFLGNSDYPDRVQSRLKVLKKLPFDHIECLGLDVPKVFGQAAWPNPKEVAEGLEVRDKQVYVNTFNTLTDKLSKIIEPYNNVFTHNPWGEYGHEEHVLVFKVVEKLAKLSSTNVWFSNYISPRTASLAGQYVFGKYQPHFTMRTNSTLGEQCKQAYQSEGCWTAPNDFVWFEDESFTQWLSFNQPQKQQLVNMFPVNFLSWPQFINQGNKTISDKKKTVETNKKWLFIVGCYNSGTTLLEQLLVSHPQFSGLPQEGQFCTDQLLTPMAVGLPRLWAEKPELFVMDESTENNVDATKIKSDWFSELSNPNAKVYVEKSCPNAGRIRWLNKHFENAHFIGIIRNGYAVSEGISRKTNHSISKSANQWNVSNTIMLRDLELVDNSILITYEELAEMTQATMSKIWDFVGVDAFKHNASTVMSVHGVDSTINNMNEKSFNSLNEDSKEKIRALSGELLDRFSYKSTV